MGLQVCAPWTTPELMCCEGDSTVEDCVDGTTDLVFLWSDEELILAASNLLYARTGFRWPGVCEFTVWPCIEGCHSAKHPCVRCCSYSSIELPTDYPVVTVEEISEDGVVLDEDAYRLERGNIIVRLDGLRWQRNTFGLPGAAGVETIVEFTGGAAPPIEGAMAAAALACELKKSCNGEACALPSNVTSFARRGVSVELTDLAEMLKSGATGIPIVDHFLGVWEKIGSGTTMFDPGRRPRGQRYPA